MPSFNDVMTVTQLIDIVTFLEAQYEIEPYRRTEYPPLVYSHCGRQVPVPAIAYSSRLSRRAKSSASLTPSSF